MYVYRFDHRSPWTGLGACHALDLHFSFNNHGVWPFLSGGGWGAATKAATAATTDVFAAFVREPTGCSAAGRRPGAAGALVPWDPVRRPLHVLGGGSGPVALETGVDAAETALWEVKPSAAAGDGGTGGMGPLLMDAVVAAGGGRGAVGVSGPRPLARLG